MKKLMFLLAIVTSMFFVSCEKDILDDVIFDLTCEVKVDSVSVFGGNDGKIIVKVLTGNKGYGITYTSSAKSGDNIVINGDSLIIHSLTSGNYNFTVTDDASKSFTKSVSVYQPEELKATVTVNHNDTSWVDNCIVINASGGKKPYVYQILDKSNNQLNSDPNGVFSTIWGTFDVIVTDNLNTKVIISDVEVFHPFKINVAVFDANNHSDDNGKINVQNFYKLENISIKLNDGDWFNPTFGGDSWYMIENVKAGNHTIYAKDEHNRIRTVNVTVGTTYTKLRIGDEYNKNGDVGRVFFVDEPNNKALIAWNTDEVSANWNESKNLCYNRGTNWTMPTMVQLGYLMDAFKNDNRFNITRNVNYWSLNRINGTSNVNVKKIDLNNVITDSLLIGSDETITRAIKEVVNEK